MNEIEHLIADMNGDFPNEEKRNMWGKLKHLLQEALELGNGMADEMRKDAERWEQEAALETPARGQTQTHHA